MIGFSEVLLDRMFGEINDRQEEYLRDIWSSGKHLLALLSEILDLSKVEAGRMEMENVTFSVRGARVRALDDPRARRESWPRPDPRCRPAVGDVETDELRFKQVVLNLLSNAVKFTPDGGEIVVAAKVEKDDLVITVADTGVGVAPEDCERIFESFQQGSRGALAQEGTGLGLIVPAHRRADGWPDVARQRVGRRQHVRVHRPHWTRGCRTVTWRELLKSCACRRSS